MGSKIFSIPKAKLKPAAYARKSFGSNTPAPGPRSVNSDKVTIVPQVNSVAFFEAYPLVIKYNPKGVNTSEPLWIEIVF